MPKPIIIIVMMVLFNVMLGVLFVSSNYYIWNTIDQLPYTSPHWNPLHVSYVPRIYVNGMFVYAQTVITIPNFPFWLFWVAMIANILFAVLLQRSKQGNP
jgi:hypothetical protein